MALSTRQHRALQQLTVGPAIVGPYDPRNVTAAIPGPTAEALARRGLAFINPPLPEIGGPRTIVLTHHGEKVARQAAARRHDPNPRTRRKA